MSTNAILRDERPTIENGSFRWAYLILAYGILGSAIYRGFVSHERSSDLLALVIASGVCAVLYKAGHRVLSRQWAILALAAVVIAFGVAALLALRTASGG